MPLYAYKCSDCEHEFQRIQKMSSDNPPCPRVKPQTTPGKDGGLPRLHLNRDGSLVGDPCGGETERLISLGSFTLKGSGWEADGYA